MLFSMSRLHQDGRLNLMLIHGDDTTSAASKESVTWGKNYFKVLDALFWGF